MIGQTLSHYRIEAKIGAGGMGEVYRALDLALGRTVALKLLPPALDDGLRGRWLREAAASARLQHPGIATFYEAGEHEGRVFIAMEMVQGTTLRSRLQDGPLSIQATLRLATGLLEALGHAHAAGILHRDLKPENVMLLETGGSKLLDFGLAKQLSMEEAPEGAPESRMDTLLTAPGMILGTPGYMAPEQLTGEPVDERSDLFSVAALLYETVSGRAAFPGGHPTERLAATLSRDPAPLPERELWSILSRALDRRPAHRFPNSRSFLLEIRRLDQGDHATQLPETLAVLDPENLSGDSQDSWIGSGLAESLAADLGRVERLTLIAREKVLAARSALAGPDGRVDPAVLGLSLGCRWVVTGAWQKVGPALRVTLRMIEASTGHVIHTEKVDAGVEKIFEVQDRLAASCTRALALKMPAPSRPVGASLTAYEAYARARRLWFRMEKGTFDQAREYYEWAIDAEPQLAPALAGLAALHALRFTFTTDPGELEKSSQYARRAIAVDPRMGEPHIWLGYALMRQGKADDGLEEELTAIRLDPGNYFAPYFAGCCHLVAARPAPAIPLFQEAIRLDASASFNWLALGWTQMWLRQYREATWTLTQAVEREGGSRSSTAGVAGFLGECLRQAGDVEAARKRCLEALDVTERTDHMYRDTFRGVCLCALGRTALDQEDLAAARAAFSQAVLHLKGRVRTLGGGHLVVQALAGLARCGEPGALDEALAIWETRAGHDFTWFYGCAPPMTLVDLARAAEALGDRDRFLSLRERAIAAGALPWEP